MGNLANLDLEIQNAENKRDLVNQELERLNNLIAQLQETRLNDYGENSSTLINPSSLLNKYDFDGDGIISIIDYYILLGAIDEESFVVDNELYDPEGSRDGTPTFNGKSLNIFDNSGDDLEINDLDMAEYINLLFEKIYSFIDINLGPNIFKRYNNNFNDGLEENDSDLEAIKHYWNTFGRIPTLDELKNFNPSINQYFTIESLEAENEIKFISHINNINEYNPEITKDIYWTNDLSSGSWNKFTCNKDCTKDSSLSTITTLNENQKIYIKAANNKYYHSEDYIYFSFNSTKECNISGNIMSLIYGDDFNNKQVNDEDYLPYTGVWGIFDHFFINWKYLKNAKNLALPATILKSYCYEFMFLDCTSLTTAPELPATTLAYDCYYYMFQNCTSLETAPKLPATTLANADNCYQSMFSGCSSLETAPELPATTLSGCCYYGMFRNCKSLKKAPKLPGAQTKLEVSCYSYMFSGCTSLRTAPTLTANTLVNSCYAGMFMGCTSLKIAPKLFARNLAVSCYEKMFWGCTSLEKFDLLPATKLTTRCYFEMFQGCTSLITAPVIKAQTLAEPKIELRKNDNEEMVISNLYGCMDGMFINCTNLRIAPELPITKLTTYCYNRMFQGCISLTNAPKLPATLLIYGCYNNMFLGCSKLNFIECHGTNFTFDSEISKYNLDGTNVMRDWLYGVSSTGTFITDNYTMIFANHTESNGIPNGWEILTEDEYEALTYIEPNMYYDAGIGSYDNGLTPINNG